MVTRVRLPTTPVPPPSDKTVRLDGPVEGLLGLLLPHNDPSIAARVENLKRVCVQVLVVDDGSSDDCAARAEAAGARVLRLGSEQGEGVALRAGLHFGRELGHIGALLPGPVPLPASTLDELARAFVRVPEALLMAVGEGQALAGKEWEEVAALARGEQPAPYPKFRPPKAGGLTGRAERAFERLVETRFSFPWGGPRILPLQSCLRMNTSERGPGVHMELLAAGSAAGIPSIEIEVPECPDRPVQRCRKIALRLLAKWAPSLAFRTLKERFGKAGGYAPPTTSPLLLALSASLLLALAGCVKQAPPIASAQQSADCEAELPRAQWPGAGDADAALRWLIQSKEQLATVWVDQEVEISDPGLRHTQRLKGVMVRDGQERLRVRLLAPLGMTVLDYVRAGERWQLIAPQSGINERGDGDRAITDIKLPGGGDPGLARLPVRISSLLSSLSAASQVRWTGGRCAVLEEVVNGAVTRRAVFGQDTSDEGDWRLVAEELVEQQSVVMRALYSDFRPAGGGLWPWRSEIQDPGRGSSVVLLTKALRTEGITDVFFAIKGG